MKRLEAIALLLLVGALALVQAKPTFTFTEEDLESDEALWEMYGRWAAHYEVVREPSRFPTFKDKAHKQHSKKRMGLNVFGDKSFFNEATRSCVSDDELAMDQLPVVDLVQPAVADADLPLRVDWREAHAVTFVKNQRECGACWAFATAAALEGVHAIKTKSVAISLSTQFLLDCTIYIDGWSGCKGGSILSALKLVKSSGIPRLSLYSYTGVQGTCDASKIRTSVTVTSWSLVTRFDVNRMKWAVSQQPILVNIGVDDEFFNWGDHRVSSNIYHGPGNTTLSHSVVIVGYDVDDLGDLYWIVKNSWGPGWGNRGWYIFISAAANDGFVGRAGVAGILTSGILIKSETY